MPVILTSGRLCKRADNLRICDQPGPHDKILPQTKLTDQLTKTSTFCVINSGFVLVFETEPYSLGHRSAYVVQADPVLVILLPLLPECWYYTLSLHSVAFYKWLDLMCSHLFSIAVTEHSDQKQIREQRVYLAYTPGQSVTKKSWGRNSGRALGGMLLIGSVSFF